MKLAHLLLFAAIALAGISGAFCKDLYSPGQRIAWGVAGILFLLLTIAYAVVYVTG